MTFGERLRDLRKQKKHTQAEVADALGVPRTTYASWESDYRFPGDEQGMLDKIAQYFGVSVDYLLGRTDERRPARPRGGYDLNEVAKRLPPDLAEAIMSLPEESRHVFLRAKRDLTEEHWRAIIAFIKFQLAEAEKRKKGQE